MLTVVLLCLMCRPAILPAAEVDHQPQTQLDRWLDIDWSLGPDLPQGFQDSDGGMLGTQLITVGGFCSGGLPEDNRRKPGRYPRGFLKKTWSLDIAQPDANWIALPEFPGAARQGLFSVVVDETLYCWGGFSYDAPFCYADGYRLQRQSGGDWQWQPLPSLPGNITSAGLSAVGSMIFLSGGADYDGVTGFFTEHDREKQSPRLGARLFTLDTKRLELGWQLQPECPGTPRFVHTVQTVNGQLYVIGGATGDFVKEGQRYGYCTVVDNWRFDPIEKKWNRLRDLPVSSGNFPKSSNLVLQNRYIVLPGGHQYGHVANPDGTVRAAYGAASRKRPESGLHNDVFIYDTITNRFGTGTALPIDNNLPMSVIRGDQLYLIGGETGGGEINGKYYGHHPDLLLIGKLKLAEHAGK